MARPQNSPRGLFAKQQIDIGSQSITYNSTSVNFEGGVKVSNAAGGLMTANSTTMTIAKALTLGGILTLGGAITGSGDGAAVLVTATAALPGDVSAEGFAFLSNSTGRALLVNTTGTTWKYLNVTSAQPT